MQREVLGAFHHGAVEGLLVEFGAEGDGDQSLGLTTGEHSRAVGLGQHVDFGPDGTHLVGLTAIEADALVKDGVAHSRAFHVVEVTLGKRSNGLKLFFGIFFEIFVKDASEGLFAEVGDCLSLSIEATRNRGISREKKRYITLDGKATQEISLIGKLMVLVMSK